MICKRCVMDETAAGIVFSDAGFCNFCEEIVVQKINNTFYQNDNERKTLIAKVKREGLGKPYDCIIGVSGGADSAWSLHLAKMEGLRPLAVHMDNGWNSELAQYNISNLVSKLDVDFYSHVINWKEYRSLQQSFFDADVIDIELLMDNAMIGVNYKLAKKYKINYIFSGSNNATEGMRMPENWNWYKYDKQNIVNINKKYQKTKIKTFPIYSTFNFLVDTYFRKIRWIPFLDYYDYDKAKAMNHLSSEYGYKQYPYKHYESVFTRFYQGYILPNKFGVDKRKLHLSTLVINDQMSRKDALQLLSQSSYPKAADLDNDLAYFLKKMNWTRKALDNYLVRPEKTHFEYGTEKDKLKTFVEFIKKILSKELINRLKRRAS